MRQVLQSVRSGVIAVAAVPPPQVRAAGILVRTAASAISPGTERAMLEFARQGLIGKARSRPDLVRQVLDKIRRDGFLEAARVTLGRLDRPVAVGYASAGTVIGVGAEASEFAVGDRVACAGAGYANHADVSYVPRNLAVSIPPKPDGSTLAYEEAAFATLGAIALHGVRLGEPAVRDRVAVVGLGLIGLLALQILKAQGCVVLGVDPNPVRRELARRLGAADACAPDEAGGRAAGLAARAAGADVVIIAASAADSGPVELAARLARDRARVVAIGATGLDLPRRGFYEKELTLVVSRSYGPGRYDAEFEEHGRDYPVGYVRWTERENMRAFLELLAEGRVDVAPLISHRVPVDEALAAYERLDDPEALALVLDYGAPADGGAAPPAPTPVVQLRPPAPRRAGRLGVSVVGAGAFAQDMLLPILKRLPSVELRGIVTGGGLGARVAADRFGFAFCAAEARAVWDDGETDAVVIATRHDQHARLVEEAIAAGKAVFVEKPLCVTEEELDRIVAAHDGARRSGWSGPLVVGFNRRFAPLVRAARDAVCRLEPPLALQYRINAGRLAPGSWVAEAGQGGGRIIGEVCHFVDLAAFLIGSPVVSVHARAIPTGADDVLATLGHANGSVSTIGFHTGGDRAASKERVEVIGGGAVVVIDDFRRGSIVRNGRRRRLGRPLGPPRKGHREELSAFVESARLGGEEPVPFAEAVAATQVTFAIRESLSRGIAIGLANV